MGTTDKYGPAFDPNAFPWASINAQHFGCVRLHMLTARDLNTGAPRWAKGTINVALAALRGVCREAWRDGLITDHAWIRIQDVKSVGRADRGRHDEAARLGRSLSPEDVGAVIDAIQSQRQRLQRVRDHAMFTLMYVAGVRRSELVMLAVDDISLVDAPALAVMDGKGREKRTVYLSHEAVRPLRAWLDVRGTRPGPFLLPLGRAVRIPARPRHMSTQSVWQATQRWAKLAGIEPFSPHDLRRTFAAHSLAAGMDLSMLKRQMGHSDVSTTILYDRRQSREQMRAAQGAALDAGEGSK